MGFILGQDCPQMLLAEDEHPVGDLGPGGTTDPIAGPAGDPFPINYRSVVDQTLPDPERYKGYRYWPGC
jgi:hypothetical protein